jgi:hypothetical protein
MIPSNSPTPSLPLPVPTLSSVPSVSSTPSLTSITSQATPTSSAPLTQSRSPSEGLQTVLSALDSPTGPKKTPFKASSHRLQIALNAGSSSNTDGPSDPITKGFLSAPPLSVPFAFAESDPKALSLLLGLCDDFIDDVLSYACTLAKHRSSLVLQACDIRAALG